VNARAVDVDATPATPLGRCVGDVDAFIDGAWGRRASLHGGADPRGFGDLLTLDGVDRAVTAGALRTPYFRLVRAGDRIPESAYTRSGRTGSRDVHGIADPARVAALFGEGATIVLQGLHRWSEPVTRFCRDLELELGHPCQANAYVTPSGAQGLDLHADPHDVFVLQAFGSKRWHVDPAPAGGEPIEATLEPGDVLYMPRGTPHAAAAQTVASGHLTVGVHVTSWRDVLADAWRGLGDDPAVAGDVPAGWLRDPDAFARELGTRLAMLAASLRDAVDPVAVAERRLERFLSTRAQLGRGTVAVRAAPVEIDDGTELRRRAGAICVLRGRGDRLLALLGDRRLEMPAWLEPAMRAVATADRLRVGDLAPHLPDAASRLVLARRLVREGLLEPADDPDGGDG
jgi:hypothetical protein